MVCEHNSFRQNAGHPKHSSIKVDFKNHWLSWDHMTLGITYDSCCRTPLIYQVKTTNVRSSCRILTEQVTCNLRFYCKWNLSNTPGVKEKKQARHPGKNTQLPLYSAHCMRSPADLFAIPTVPPAPRVQLTPILPASTIPWGKPRWAHEKGSKRKHSFQCILHSNAFCCPL